MSAFNSGGTSSTAHAAVAASSSSAGATAGHSLEVTPSPAEQAQAIDQSTKILQELANFAEKFCAIPPQSLGKRDTARKRWLEEAAVRCGCKASSMLYLYHNDRNRLVKSLNAGLDRFVDSKSVKAKAFEMATRLVDTNASKAEKDKEADKIRKAWRAGFVVDSHGLDLTSLSSMPDELIELFSAFRDGSDTVSKKFQKDLESSYLIGRIIDAAVKNPAFVDSSVIDVMEKGDKSKKGAAASKAEGRSASASSQAAHDKALKEGEDGYEDLSSENSMTTPGMGNSAYEKLLSQQQAQQRKQDARLLAAAEEADRVARLKRLVSPGSLKDDTSLPESNEGATPAAAAGSTASQSGKAKRQKTVAQQDKNLKQQQIEIAKEELALRKQGLLAMQTTGTGRAMPLHVKYSNVRDFLSEVGLEGESLEKGIKYLETVKLDKPIKLLGLTATIAQGLAKEVDSEGWLVDAIVYVLSQHDVKLKA